MARRVLLRNLGTDAENAVVDRVRDQLGSIPDSSFEKFESPDHLVHMEGFHKGGKNGTPRASTVLDEDICTCAAWTFQVMAALRQGLLR